MRFTAITALTIALASCVHTRIAEPTQTSHADTRSVQPVTLTPETDAFQHHLTALRRSSDPIASPTADLLDAMNERGIREKLRRCNGDKSSPLRITVIGRTTITEDGIADEIEVGLSRHGDFIVSGRRALVDVDSLRVEEHGGLFAEETVQPVGAFAGLDALGVVTVRHVRAFAIATVRIICSRTLEEVASARASFPKTGFIAPDESPSDIVLQQRARERQQSQERIAQCQQYPEKPGCHQEEMNRKRYRERLLNELAEQMRKADRLLKENEEDDEEVTGE